MYQILDKTFVPFINSEKLKEAVFNISKMIALDHQYDKLLFLGILNGSFMFCSDLLKAYNHPCEISFIKLASYEQTSSTGIVNELIGLNEELTNRTVIVLEDIVDTGTTLEKVIDVLKQKNAKTVKVASLFLKSTVYKKEIPIDYVGMKIPNKFILGYGMDYDGFGRNLPEIYVLQE